MAVDTPKILAIDDKPDNLITLKAVVRDALPGSAVVTAADGPQGLALAVAEDPDVILLDIVMPGMDGYEVCRRLKADDRTRHIPVIFLTALRADRESRVRALEAGAEAFLTKPLDEVELTAQIRAMAKIKAAVLRTRRENERLAALVAERTAALEKELLERQRVEAAERQHAAQLNGIYRAAPVGIGMVVNRVIQEVNDTLCSMTGYVRAELLGQNARMLYPTEGEYEYVGREKYRQIAEHDVGSVETHWRRKDGKIISVLLSSAALDPADPTRGVAFSALDITERKRTEEALRESEDKFKYVFDHSVVAKSLTLPTGEVNANQAFADMLGYTRAELQNLKWQDITHPDDMAISQDRIAAGMAGTGGQVRFTKRYLRRDGGVVWADVNTSLRRDSAGNPLYFMTTVVDITERVQAEQALRRAREQLAATLDALPDLLFETDRDGRIYDYRAPSLAALFVPAGSFLGQRVVDVLPQEAGKIIMDAIAQAAEHGQHSGAVYCLNFPSGPQWFELSIAARGDAKATEARFVILARDISERIAAEAALRESEERFRVTQEVSPDGFTILSPVRDANGRVVDFIWVYENATVARWNGTDPKAVVGKRLLELFPGHAGTQFMAAYQSVAETGAQIVFEDVYRGETIANSTWFRIIVVPTGPDIAILAQNITEGKQAEMALQESEARLRAVLDASPFPVAVVDLRDEKIYFWSRSALDLFGHTAPTTAEWYQLAYPDPNYRRDVIARWKPCLDTARASHATVNTGEYRVTCADGSVRLCELYATFLPNNLIVTFNDITERRQAEDKIQQQLHELQRWYTVTIDRETRSLELKHEVNNLLRRLNEPIRYPSAEQ